LGFTIFNPSSRSGRLIAARQAEMWEPPAFWNPLADEVLILKEHCRTHKKAKDILRYQTKTGRNLIWPTMEWTEEIL
jgi:hypothetical protein